MEWVLVPILTGKEIELLDQLDKASKTVLVYVVDEGDLEKYPASAIGTKIKEAEQLMETMKSKLVGEVKDYVEWGRWVEKVKAIAELEQVDKIIMIDCDLARKIKKAVQKDCKIVKI